MFGGSTPQINRGIVDNKGIELSIGYHNQIRDFSYFANANFAATKNKIVNQDEQFRTYAYQVRTGLPIGERFGLVALGLFQDQEEIDKSPSQAAYGTIRPGDIKYKDINGDGIINSDDEVRIGSSQVPSITYAFSLGMSYKGFDIKALFQGTGRSQAILSGIEVFEFVNNGKVKPEHLNRWAYYTDPNTGELIDTRASATYPRLSLSETTNNRQASTYWLRDVHYLRLKTLELGYSFDRFLKNTFISHARIYLSGYNILTFSPIKGMDPEMVGNPTAYPIQKAFNLGINLTF